MEELLKPCLHFLDIERHGDGRTIKTLLEIRPNSFVLNAGSTEEYIIMKVMVRI